MMKYTLEIDMIISTCYINNWWNRKQSPNRHSGDLCGKALATT